MLKDFEIIESPLDWEVGKHGIEIEFKEKGKTYRGTYLPNVAPEQGWDQTTALSHLIEKAGYYGKLLEIQEWVLIR